jgi:hypothetical protein
MGIAWRELIAYHDTGPLQQIHGGQQIEDQPNLLSSLNLLEEQAFRNYSGNLQEKSLSSPECPPSLLPYLLNLWLACVFPRGICITNCAAD